MLTKKCFSKDISVLIHTPKSLSLFAPDFDIMVKTIDRLRKYLLLNVSHSTKNIDLMPQGTFDAVKFCYEGDITSVM